MKPTLTIGIAAYNEQNNIGALLRALQKQNVHSARLEECVVVSDASEDQTDDIVKTFSNVTLIRQMNRSGLSRVQECLREHARTDILVILDADILPAKDDTIENLIAPLCADPSLGLLSAKITPAEPRTFVESILARNHLWKTELFASLGDGNSLLTCFGPARAFSRALYSSIHIPNNTPVDAASYLLCKGRGMRFVFVEDASFLFRCPSTLKDHLKQSKRFSSGRNAIGEVFGQEALHEYHIPRSTLLFAAIRELVRHPVLFIGFVYIYVYSALQNRSRFTSAWDVALTSKKI